MKQHWLLSLIYVPLSIILLSGWYNGHRYGYHYPWGYYPAAPAVVEEERRPVIVDDCTSYNTGQYVGSKKHINFVCTNVCERHGRIWQGVWNTSYSGSLICRCCYDD
jgi:hypothetical protein